MPTLSGANLFDSPAMVQICCSCSWDCHAATQLDRLPTVFRDWGGGLAAATAVVKNMNWGHFAKENLLVLSLVAFDNLSHSFYSSGNSSRVIVLDGQRVDVFRGSFIPASGKSACYQKYVGGEIEGTASKHHTSAPPCQHFFFQNKPHRSIVSHFMVFKLS